MFRFDLYFYCILFIAISYVDSAAYNFRPDVGRYYKFHSEAKPWYDAKLACEKENATLAMPRNYKEVKALKTILSGYPPSMLTNVPQPDYLLLGFHDAFEEGEYLSVRGEPLQNYFHTWYDGQPDNFHEEDCGSLHRSGKLNDFSCHVPSVFICQKGEPGHGSIESDNHCATNDIGYRYAGDLEKCYKLHLNPRKWPDARAICYAEGGHLAVIKSKEEEDYLVEIFNNPEDAVPYAQRKEYALIGFHDLYREGHYVTVTNEELHHHGYVNWAPGNPDNRDGENCGSMTKTGALNDLSCGAKAVFICEQPAAALDARFSQE